MRVADVAFEGHGTFDVSEASSDAPRDARPCAQFSPQTPRTWLLEVLSSAAARAGAFVFCILVILGASIAAIAPPTDRRPSSEMSGLPSDPFRPGGVFACTGIAQLSPREARLGLEGLGYRASWRLVTSSSADGMRGVAEQVSNPPDGIIVGGGWEANGAVIVLVAPIGDPAAMRIQRPAGC